MEIINTILTIFSVAIGIFFILYAIALYLASEKIFSGSGVPITMANILLRSIMTAGQIIVGIAILTVITILIVSNKISSDTGLPIISILTGYLVGRNFDNKIIK